MKFKYLEENIYKLRTKNEKYLKKKVEHSLLAKSLHWVFIVMFGYGVIKQIESKEQLNDTELLKTEVIFALIFLAFIVLRFIYMKKKYKTSLPSDTPTLHRLAAKFIHILMYVTLSGIAISGLGIGFLFWLGYQNSYLIEFTIWSHEVFFSAAIWLISLHVLAAIYHRVRHDFVWSSMVPFFKEKS